MGVREYLLDEPAHEWKETPKAKRKTLSDGLSGRPQVTVSLPDDGNEAVAHFHDVAQFQLCLQGTITFPGHPLEPIGVYYSDPYMAYGPFVVGSSHKRSVLRPAKAGHSLEGGQVQMSNLELRNLRNPHGREFYGESREVSWEDLKGELAGIRRKVLFGTEGEAGPKAQLWECPPNASLRRHEAQFGEYHVLVEGSAQVDDQERKPHFMRYVVGDGPTAPLTSGPVGATWLILTFDQAAELKSPTGEPVQGL